MSIKDLTITDQNVQSVYVQSQPDRLTGTAQQNKAVFDAFPQLIRQRFNELLEALAGTGGAGEIPVGPIEGVTAENVQQALAAIQHNLTAYINKIKAETGAAEVGVSPIGGMTAQNVQKALEELRKAIDDSVSGIIPGGSITANMLADDVTGDSIPVSQTDRTPIRAALENKAGFDDNLCLDLNEYLQRYQFVKVNNTTIHAPSPMDLGAAVNFGYDKGAFAQLVFARTGYIFARGYAGWSPEGSRFTDWVKIGTATPPQVRNLTLQPGFTKNSDCTFFVTQESTVHLAGGVSGTLPANQDTQIGTLQADVRPTYQCRRPAVTNAGAAYIYIHTDGTVWAHPFAAAAGCWFDCSFVAVGGQ